LSPCHLVIEGGNVVLMLFVLLLLTWFVVTVLLAALTLLLQSSFYTEPVGQLQWRAPAAGGAIALFIVLWVIFDYNSPGNYREVQKFSYVDYIEFSELRFLDNDGKKYHVYARRGTKSWEHNGKGAELPAQPVRRIIAKRKDDPKEYAFVPPLDERQAPMAENGVFHYRNDDEHWEMVSGQLGYVAVSHPGQLIGNLLLNVLHLAVWFVALWLLLHFQWGHALGLAVVFWLAMTFVALPGLLDSAEKVYDLRHRPTAPEPASTPARP
jgi:hypothetical protein